MTPTRTVLPALAFLALLGLATLATAEEPGPTPDQARFFEAKVRPVLVENCLKCHGEAKQKGGLRLDSREAILTGGDSGPAVEPGDPDASLLVEAIGYETIEMPPTGKLPEPARVALTEWVRLGAPWPGSASVAAASPGVAKKVGRTAAFTAEDRAWWAFQPVQAPAVPEVEDGGWSRGPLDRFLFARMKAEGLTPAPEADKIALIRRATFDVTGLPPTPAEVSAFLADDSPDAYETLVDRLLASPHYGERWARHWLDLVRYAESDGYRLDSARPNAWLYRDYVIRSFNDDKPYDRLVTEQIAGDELYPGDPEALIATGYLRHGIYEYNNRDARGQWSVMLDDITDTTADVFLGLGLQCARCHNHKFDPILQADYYRLQGFFAPILPRDDLVAATPSDVAAHRAKMATWEAETAELRIQIEAIEAKHRPGAARDATRKFPDDIQAMMLAPAENRSPLEHQLAELANRQVIYEYTRLDGRIKGKDKEDLLALRKKLTAFDQLKPHALPLPMAVTDVGPAAPPVFIPKKGEAAIAPGFPTILEPGPATIESLAQSPGSTGRRAALARWLTRDDNPLSTRVIVNRVWQYHFGRGLAASSSDFGRLGETPSHPELLDWLTTEFVRGGWKLKPLHRLILTSAAYRQSSDNPAASACQVKDPENRYYWRGNIRRLDAEQVRDAVLAVAGELDPKVGGPGVPASEPRLTIYTKSMRNTRDPLLDVFDLPLFFNSTPSRDTTTTPLQSLLLINGQAMILHARALADRLEREADSKLGPAAMVADAYRLAFGRGPTADELATVRAFLHDQAGRIDPDAAGGAEAAFLHDKVPYRDGQAAVLSPDRDQKMLETIDRDPMPAGPFTVEGFFLLRSVYENASVRAIAARWDGNPGHPGWSFGVTGKGSRRKPQTLVLQLVGTGKDGKLVEEAVFSDQNIQIDKPYYAAASVVPAGDGPGSVTFTLKDLSNDDEPILIAKVGHAITGGTATALPLTLGGRSGAREAAFDGLLDDVRLSDAALDVDQLLITAEGVGRNALGYWRFEPQPGVFRDATGHGLDLRPAGHAASSLDPRRAALVDFCHVLLNSSEFLYVH